MQERFDTILNWLTAHPRITSLLTGLLAATGFAPLGLWWLALIAVAAFFVLLSNIGTWKQAFVLGWLFGFAHFTFGNNWIATAFTYQSNMPAVLGWAAVPLLSLYLAMYPAIAAAAAVRLAGRAKPVSLVLAFAGCWIVAEWLRSWVFTGYAWNPLGIVLLGGFETPGIARVSPWFGTYGLSGLTILIAGALWRLTAIRKWPQIVAIAAVLMLGMYLPSLSEAQDSEQSFTLVQPDIRQEVLNDPAQYEANFIKTADLTRENASAKKRIILWPESGVPDYLRDGYPQQFYDRATAMGDPVLARQRIGRIIGEDALLLTGTIDLELEGDRAIGARNVVTVLDGAGEIKGSYAKAHLVPYGEYLPMRPILEPLGLSRLVPGAIDFWPGPGPQTLDLADYGRAGIQICYEIIFAGQVVDREDRPDFIFNPSNDGWFGAFGPPQHLAQARLRAIEEGLPVLRSTTTGISAVIDAGGVVRDYAPMRVAKRLDGFIPQAKQPTLFARVGNILSLGWAMVFILLSLLIARVKAHQSIPEQTAS